MAKINIHLMRALASAATIHDSYTLAANEFTELCRASRWTEAEAARQRAVAHMEAYLDHIAAAYKRLELEG